MISLCLSALDYVITLWRPSDDDITYRKRVQVFLANGIIVGVTAVVVTSDRYRSVIHIYLSLAQLLLAL